LSSKQITHFELSYVLGNLSGLFRCDWYFDIVVHFAFQWILQITFASAS